VIEMLRQARGSVSEVEASLATLRRRVRQLEDENERLRHGPHGGAA
jgi:cell division protein FtsB